MPFDDHVYVEVSRSELLDIINNRATRLASLCRGYSKNEEVNQAQVNLDYAVFLLKDLRERQQKHQLEVMKETCSDEVPF